MQGVTCVAYGPLGHGKEGLLTHAEITKIAEETGKTPAQVRGPRRRHSRHGKVARGVVSSCTEDLPACGAPGLLEASRCPQLLLLTMRVPQAYKHASSMVWLLTLHELLPDQTLIPY